MGKAFGALLRFLIALFIIGLVGYNTYEIAQLRAEVAGLRGGAKSGSFTRSPPHGTGTMEQIAEARSHAERASTLLKQKKLAEAADEMQAASDAAARASGNAQAETRNTVASVQKSLAKLSSETAALWKQAESFTKKENGGASASPTPNEKKNDKNSNKSE